MAPILDRSQHDIIQDMLLDKKLKTKEMADIVECSEDSVKAIRLNLHYYGSTKAPSNGGSDL